MSIIPFAHKHQRAIIFTISVLALAGVYAAINLPITLFPEITFPRIMILADNGEQPIARMMIEVTKPLEEAARGVPGVVTVRSATNRGSSEISINFTWGTDIFHALQLLQGRIAAVRNEMPATASIHVERMDISVFPVMGFSLTSDKRSQVELRDLALYTLRPALLRIQGVGQIRITGGKTREFHVVVDPMALASYNLDIREVNDAINNANLVASTGLVSDNYHLYLSLTDNLFTRLDEIGNVVIALRHGAPVRIKDVAQVSSGEEDVFVRISANGKDAVLLDIMRQPDGNIVQIGAATKTLLAEMRNQIPPDVEIKSYFDQGEFVSDSIAGARDAILIGVALAMLVLLYFMKNWRITLVAAIVVPATIAATIGCLFAIGATINVMTLGGIAAAVGLIIDDIIVVVESIFHHFHKGEKDFMATAHGAVQELLPAIVGSSLATLVIHIPFAFLSGVTGAFFAALSVTMVFALSLSFIFSVIFAPLVAGAVLTENDIENAISREQKSRHRLLHVYERALRGLLRRKWLVLPLILILMIGGWRLYQQTGTGFMPDMDEGTFVLDYLTPPGTSFEETDRMLKQVEEILRTTPEVENFGRRTGTELGFFITESNAGDILVKLKHERARSIFAVIDDIRRRIEQAQPTMELEFGQQMQDVIGDLIGWPSPIEIQIFGDNKAQLEEKARQVAELITPIRGVEDVYDGITISGSSILIKVDQTQASRAGLTVSDVQAQLENLMKGKAETSIQRGEKLIGIRTRYNDLLRNDLVTIKQVQLQSPNGFLVPLASIATIATTKGEAQIHREDLKQLVSVTARTSGRDLGSTVAEIQRTLKRRLVLPTGVSIHYGGTYQTQQESFRGLLLVLAAAVLFVFIVLLFEFESFRVPLTVFLINLPSLFGVVFALWLTNVTFNVSSFVGTILVVGIVAENAIFLLHYVVKYQGEGMAWDEALVQASLIRVRPILMTTFAAVFALLPLALNLGAGTQMQQPLAIAVIGGFSVSTLLLLFALPMVFGLMQKKASEGNATGRGR